jgi:hypothetical protein
MTMAKAGSFVKTIEGVEGPVDIHDVKGVITTNSALRDSFRALCQGPCWDGNLPSKSGRDALVELGFADRCNGGWNFLTAEGVQAAAKLGLIHEG